MPLQRWIWHAAQPPMQPFNNMTNDSRPSDIPSSSGKIDPRLLEILVCPVSGDTLEYDATRQELISRRVRLAYPIRDGIPIMLTQEARILEG